MPLPKYPYSDFHEINLDYILMMLRENSGLHLQMINNKLHLLNDLEESVSNVTITYAEKALTSMSGKELDLFIFSAGTAGNNLVFTDGEGTVTSLTVPFATKAEKDNLDQAITSYVKSVQVSGDKLRFNLGDSTNYELTVPFATKASTSETGKNIDTFAASLLVDGNELVLKDNLNNELSRITVQYSEKANKDSSGNVIISSYANDLQAGTTTVKLLAMDGSLLSEITVPYATAATNDNLGNSFLSSYAAKLVVNGNKIDLESMNDTVLSSITVPFATLSTDATNAIETVSISGNQMIFTTYGGQSYSITCPYAVSALKDGLQNEIAETYVANITNDNQTGKITFYDAKGQVMVELIPTVDKATHDSYNNLIADFIKQISVDPNSNYVTVTHGTGTTDSLVINYAAHAWKDTNDHVIKNFYISYLECVEDINDGHYKLVAYDGDTPRAELFRVELTAYSAQTDINGVALTSYVHDVSAIPLQSGGQLKITYGDGTTSQFVVPKAQEANYASTAASATLATTAHKDMNGHNLTDFMYYASPYSQHGIEIFDGNGNSKYQYDPIPNDSAATSGDVLSTDGVGNLSWITPSGGGTTLPPLPQANIPIWGQRPTISGNMQQNYAILGGGYEPDTQEIQYKWLLKDYLLMATYDNDEDTSGSAMLTNYTLPYAIPACSSVPFGLIIEANDARNADYNIISGLKYVGYSTYDITLRSSGQNSYNVGFVPLYNTAFYLAKSLLRGNTPIHIVKQEGDVVIDCVMNITQKFGGVGNYRIFSGRLYNCDSSNKSSYSLNGFKILYGAQIELEGDILSIRE